MLCSEICCFVHWFCRLKMHEESSSRRKADEDVHEGAVPAYLLDRENTSRAKVCVCFDFDVDDSWWKAIYMRCV